MIFSIEILGFMTALMLTILAVANWAEKKDRDDIGLPPRNKK